MDFFYGLFFLLAITSKDIQVRTSDYDESHFVNLWAAEIPGGPEVARQVAEQHDYRIVRTLHHIPDHYELARTDTPHRSKRSADHHTQKLADDARVLYVEQQQHRPRVKREAVPPNRSSISKNYRTNDPQFEKQWYLYQEDATEVRQTGSKADLRVRQVWERNITGRGVTVTIIDDGLEWKHPDLVNNYYAKASYDFNEDDDDPTPRYEQTNENKHGTRCAGEVAMTANNNVCGVGVAYNGNIGGIKILDGVVTDSVESRALSYRSDIIDIYSSSWGPSDNGKTVEGPGKLAQRALELGIAEGRNKKGSIFVVASGNGGGNGDNCNCDGYTSSIYTISANSCSQSGKMPYYSERCASTQVSAFSSGSYTEGKVVSADLHNKCTDNHSGTSAAAPLVAGVVALMLECNGNLTWRDVQHILIATSNSNALLGNSGWYKNGIDRCVNLAFGYGLVDADKAVEMAHPKNWKGVGEQKTCIVQSNNSSIFPKEFKSGEYVSVDFVTDGCAGQDNEITAIEHIIVEITACLEKRGNTYAEIQTPSGTITSLMLERENDYSSECFIDWKLMTVHSWGENPRGTFTFRIADRSDSKQKGSLKSAKLIIYGTKDKPQYQKNLPKTCEQLDRYADTVTQVIAEDRNREGMFGQRKPSKIAQTAPKVIAADEPKKPQEKSSIDSLKSLLQSFSRG